MNTAAYCIDPDILLARGKALHAEYAAAQPFPHIAVDGFFPEADLDAVLTEFPTPETIRWQRFNNQQERKLASSNERNLGPATRKLIWELNSQVFIEFLEALTGIQGLIPDPHLGGGGLHQIERGGHLGVHVDFNRHTRLQLDRRINLLIYLNKDWQEEYGGHLELWDRQMQHCIKKVLPLYNRMVVFSTTDFSYHGHPNPLTCPEGRTRKSLALYYYSNGRPAEEISGSHSTIFRNRPGEQWQPEKPKQGRARELIKDLMPPMLLRAIRRMRGAAPAEDQHE
jgi:Rps23 Pro-64 3,4-dihydroxylase Tpa1-like proline 4-hydroxylase